MLGRLAVGRANMWVQVRKTQRSIKQVLTERFYSWTEAEKLAQRDPEIDLSGNGPIFTPSEFVEEPISEDEALEAEAAELEAELEGTPEAQSEKPLLEEAEVKPEQKEAPRL